MRTDFNYNKLTNIMCEILTQFSLDQYFICLFVQYQSKAGLQLT